METKEVRSKPEVPVGEDSFRDSRDPGLTGTGPLGERALDTGRPCPHGAQGSELSGWSQPDGTDGCRGRRQPAPWEWTMEANCWLIGQQSASRLQVNPCTE